MSRSTSAWRARLASLVFCLFSVSAVNAAEARPAPAGPSAVPPLSRVLELSRQRAPQVIIGRALVTTARSSLVGAGLPPIGNPYLELTGDAAPSRASGNVILDGRLWLPVEIAGQRSKRLEEARALVGYQTRQLALSSLLSTAEAMRAYGSVVVNAERTRVLSDLLEVAQSEAANYAARYQAGDATVRDARLAELDAARYGVLLEETRADVLAGLSDLGRLTGETYTRAPDALARPPAPGRLVADHAPALAVPRAEAAYHGRAKERAEREGSAGALSVILSGGRGELGEARVGGGVAYAFPVARRNQGEIARSEAERARALEEERLLRRLIEARALGLRRELDQVRLALDRLERQAEPAAAAAVEAATEMRRAGKSDLLPVFTSRRELGLLRLRRLDLVEREWRIVAEFVSLGGEAR